MIDIIFFIFFQLQDIGDKGKEVVPIGKNPSEHVDDDEEEEEDDEADDDDESDTTNDDELDTDMIDDRDSPDDVSITNYIGWDTNLYEIYGPMSDTTNDDKLDTDMSDDVVTLIFRFLTLFCLENKF